MKLSGGPWSRGDIFAAIGLIGVIGTILAIPGMPKFFHWDEKSTPVLAHPVPQAESPSTFTGQVTAVGRGPIVGASVIAFKDQAIGESIRTDANGQFQVQLPANIQSLRLVVSAAGFANSTIQVNPHRMGPEEIVLQKVVPASPKVRDGKVASPPVVQVGQVPAVPLSEPQPNQGIINNAPNQGIQNNCAPGVVNCDQSIHLDSLPALPVANFRLTPLSRERLESELPNRYGPNSVNMPPAAMLVIGVDRIFQFPAFQINCSAPCEIAHPEISEVGGQWVRTTSTSLADERVTADSQHFLVSLGQALSPRQGLVLIITSRDQSDPIITSVVSARQP
ncbi:MAG TPA: carboxypeptidase-like regulatory domain-containing protein [Acidobacteriaceae bacterium]